MATKKYRNDSCTIEVSNGLKPNGERNREYLTVKRERGMTDKQWEKEVDRIAYRFEEKVKSGESYDGNKITLSEFVTYWRTEYAEKKLAPKTLYEYERHIKRILQAMGHLKISKIKPTHVMKFINNLQEVGIRNDYLYKANNEFKEYLINNDFDAYMLAEMANINIHTARKIIEGKPTNKAKQICLALNNIPISEYFKFEIQKEVLSQRTVNHHFRTLSSILQRAVEWQVISENPTRSVPPPQVESREIEFLEEDEVLIMLKILENEHIKHKAWIYVAIYTGCRLGELGGLEWKDIDFKNNMMNIRQASQTLPGRGVYLKEPKNKSSKRKISVSLTAMNVLKEYQNWQNEQRLILGDRWINSGMIFTTRDGRIMYPSTPTQWFLKFRRKHNLPDVDFHGLRHTNASILIAEGMDYQTTGGRLGHENPETTAKFYSHFMIKPDKKSAEKLEKAFNTKAK